MKKRILTSVSIFIFSFFNSYAQPYTIYTIAGNGTAAYSGDGGPATAAELFSAFGVRPDALGNIYIGDTYNNRIRKIDPSGIISTFAGTGYGTPFIGGFSGDGGPATAAELGSPCGMAIDAAGNIYFADWRNTRVRKINTSGIITTVAGNGSLSYSGDGGPATAGAVYLPTDVAVDATGNLYIADYGNSRIRMVNTSGIITTIAGTGVAGFSGNGGPATAAKLDKPEGVAVDGTGNVYIVDSYNNRIREVNTSGIITTIAGNGFPGYSGDGGPATAASFSAPFGIALYGSNIFITDDSNAVVREINASGIITTVAGDGVHGYSGDGGPATSAELNAAGLIAADASGNIYFGDRYNNRVREMYSATDGVKEITLDNSSKIYPNPNNGKFTIERSAEKQNEKIEIYNMLGEKVYSNPVLITNSQLLINISNQPSGIYLYNIISEEGSSVAEGKFVIEK